MLGILFWVGYFATLIGWPAYSYRTYQATAPYMPIGNIIVMLLIGALGLRVFPITW